MLIGSYVNADLNADFDKVNYCCNGGGGGGGT